MHAHVTTAAPPSARTDHTGETGPWQPFEQAVAPLLLPAAEAAEAMASPRLARSWASALVMHWSRMERLGGLDLSQPLYVLDLAPGDGTLAGIMLSALEQEMHGRGMPGWPVRYVLCPLDGSCPSQEMMTDTPPPAEHFDHVGYHGTTATRVASMKKTGVDPALTGKNFGKGSQGGPGLYGTTSERSAELFASNAAASSGDQAQTLSIYRPKQARVKTAPLPPDAHYQPVKQTEFHAADSAVHEVTLGPTRMPKGFQENPGQTTLYTPHAVSDPRVNHMLFAPPPMTREKSAAIMSKLASTDPAMAARFAHMRKTGASVGAGAGSSSSTSSSGSTNSSSEGR
ncbi:MAG: hypothetical protein H0X13_18845 [Ramlibacter sp.]|nr:hypothetical protein [Ramlibacter sp.]